MLFSVSSCEWSSSKGDMSLGAGEGHGEYRGAVESRDAEMTRRRWDSVLNVSIVTQAVQRVLVYRQ
jgi:hypothetical protein